MYSVVAYLAHAMPVKYDTMPVKSAGAGQHV